MGLGYRERLSLRFVLTAVFWLGVAGIEGMLMRTVLAGGLREVYDAEHFYAMMTVHPFVGIYGWAYMAVMGAFYYLVPKVLGRGLYSERLAGLSYWLITVGVLVTWLSGFLFRFGALYTLYWPLPVVRFPPESVLVFGLGSFMIFLAVIVFFYDMFATIFFREGVRVTVGEVYRRLFTIAFNIDKVKAVFRGSKGYVPKVFTYPVFIVGVFRGCVDTTLNAVAMAAVSLLLTVYSAARLVGAGLSPGLIDPLAYKNVFWWGLDLIADGNVLIFTAATWYFLTPLLTGRRLYGESVVRTVILADLVVSLFVWNHHMLADTPQPFLLQVQGQIFTFGELITMGLTMFAVLKTIWLARPVRYTPPLAAILLSVTGFMVGGTAGLLQANYALNRYIHNTQWVIGTHAHTMLLAGLSLTLFAAIYALAPLITGKEMDARLSYAHLLLFFVGALWMSLSMGFAGVEGMLRRTLYFNGEYAAYMYSAWVGGALMAAGYLVFIVNFLRTYGFEPILLVFRG